MRRLFLIVPALIVMAAAAPTAAPRAKGFIPCPDPTKALEKAQFKRLGELPPAQAFRAVYRVGEGCDVQSIPASDRLGTFPKGSRQKRQ
jgi:hypothetical protein